MILWYRNKRKEWEDAVEAIKTEAKLESDALLAKLMREKEELQAQLLQVQNIPKEESVSLSIKDIQYPGYWSKQVADFQTFDVDQNRYVL